MMAITLVALGIVVVTWLVYPAAVALLAARRRSRRGPVVACTPTISVVIASREHATAIRARVADCLAAAYPAERLEVVVAFDAHGGDLPRLSDIVPPHAASRVVLVRGDEPAGKAAALNAGVRAATGDVVVFSDTHQRFAPDALAKLATAVMQPGIGAASGQLELLRGGRGSLVGRYWRYERRLRRDEAVLHSTVGVTGAIYALRRALWRPLPAGVLLDDVYVPMRLVLAGHRVDFVPDAHAFETRTTSPEQEYRRKVRTLTGVVQLCAWLPAVLSPARNPIWLQFVCHKLLRLLTPYCLALVVVATVAKLAVAIGVWPLLLALGLAVAALQVRARGVNAVRRLAREGMLLQLAVIVATSNSVRRRWDVWRA